MQKTKDKETFKNTEKNRKTYMWRKKKNKNYSGPLIRNHACKNTGKVNIYNIQRQKFSNLEFYIQ